MFQHVHVSDVDVDTAALQNGTNAGDRLSTNDRNNNLVEGVEITNDGTNYFSYTMNDATKDYQNIKQYNFSTPYDLSTIILASTAIVLGNLILLAWHSVQMEKDYFNLFRLE